MEITSSARLARMFGWLLKRHTIISFYLYTIGFVSFVLTLKKGRYTYQFGQYAWTHMILMVRALLGAEALVVSSSGNTLEQPHL